MWKIQKYATNTEAFSDCFKSEEPLDIQIKNWERDLESFCQKAFKKVRIRRKSIKPINSRIKRLLDLKFTNEIFKDGIIGENMKASLLIMMNGIKKNLFIPDVMKLANISTVPKNGSRLELKNERGIFRWTVLRCILMQLIYGYKYNTDDENFSRQQ